MPSSGWQSPSRLELGDAVYRSPGFHILTPVSPGSLAALSPVGLWSADRSRAHNDQSLSRGRVSSTCVRDNADKREKGITAGGEGARLGGGAGPGPRSSRARVLPLSLGHPLTGHPDLRSPGAQVPRERRGPGPHPPVALDEIFRIFGPTMLGNFVVLWGPSISLDRKTLGKVLWDPVIVVLLSESTW